MKIQCLLTVLLTLTGCVGTQVVGVPDGFVRHDIDAGRYKLLTLQRNTVMDAPVHIYVEGDGRAFNSRGMPTSDPTPRDDVVRRMAMRDTAPNVVYIARPCQFIMSDACGVADWTTGRFSPDVIDSVAAAVRVVGNGRPVVLIGYSGGAMVSGLVIQNAPDIDVRRWVTVAGVLNHADWTEYFGDTPLSGSLNLDKLPTVPQTHYVAEHDSVVPNELSRRWVSDVIVVPDVGHAF